MKLRPPIIASNAVAPGFTIVELLVASSIALIVMGAVTSLFALFGRSVSDSQTIVDLNNRMRLAANRLRLDLAGMTAPLTPPLAAESGAGYFEIVEGPQNDLSFVNDASPARLLGDTDDRLIFTTRSLTQPFSGKFDTSRIEADTAEVAWFCFTSVNQPVPGLELQTLYRRKLLVAGYVGHSDFLNNQLTGRTLPEVYNTYDISLRGDPRAGNALVPNTLSDLMQRENRFFHGSLTSIFPNSSVGLTFNAASGREGEDVVLTNVVAFDVRVFDPEAVSRTNAASAVLFPGDSGYGGGTSPAAPTPQVSGCFIDLGQGSSPNGAKNASGSVTALSGPADATSQVLTSGTATYDTWTTHYEFNGRNDDGDSLVDEGTDGVDNAPQNGLVDDADEHETAPPYDRPLKAIEIRIRCYEPTSQQIRQITIRHAF
jgi:type II secretory pathway pseudopilin PulG